MCDNRDEFEVYEHGDHIEINGELKNGLQVRHYYSNFTLAEVCADFKLCMQEYNEYNRTVESAKDKLFRWLDSGEWCTVDTHTKYVIQTFIKFLSEEEAAEYIRMYDMEELDRIEEWIENKNYREQE
jgi:hypothetical protein